LHATAPHAQQIKVRKAKDAILRIRYTKENKSCFVKAKNNMKM